MTAFFLKAVFLGIMLFGASSLKHKASGVIPGLDDFIAEDGTVMRPCFSASAS
jgi:hypothetical protein